VLVIIGIQCFGMSALVKKFYFTRDCYYTSREERKFYWVEVKDAWAYFYKTGLLKESFYSEKLNNVEDETHTRQYLQILLRSIIMIQEN